MGDRGRAQRLTPPGVGGIHVFALEGPAVEPFLGRHFRPARARGRGELRFGQLVDGADLIDEVLVHRHRLPSRSGPRVDLSIHGGPAIEKRVAALLAGIGFELSEVEGVAELGRELFTAAPALAREVQAALAEAFSLQGVLFLVSVLGGALDRELESLVHTLRMLGAGPSPRAVALESRVATLLDRAPFGLSMVEPPLLVLSGPVNVGKSTLLNRLIGRERVIVSEVPGTTRDAVEVLAEIEGYPFRMVDTAGLRDDPDPIEREGIARTHDARRRAALVLAVEDATQPPPPPGREPPATGPGGILHVLNKMDRLEPSARKARRALSPAAVAVSARDGEGLERLRSRIVFESPFRGPATREFPCPFTPRQVRGLEQAMRRLPHDVAGAAMSLAGIMLGDHEA